MFKIEDDDDVQYDDEGRVVKIDKPNTLISIIYHADGRIWMMDYQKKRLPWGN